MAAPLNLRSPITALRGVTELLAKRLAILNLTTVEELLWHVPFRYDDFQKIVTVQELTEGVTATVQGVVSMITNRRSWRTHKMVTEAIIDDGTGTVRAMWFNQPFIGKTIKQGDTIALAGEVKLDGIGLVFSGAQYERVAAPDAPRTHTGRLVPVYSTTAGLTVRHIRSLIAQVLPLCTQQHDWLTPALRTQADVVPLGQALHLLHAPMSYEDITSARRRIALEEIMPMLVVSAGARATRKKSTAPVFHFFEHEMQRFVGQLPFTLTDDQKKVIWKIIQDTAESHPMRRLIQGDVGSGKTAVAAAAAWHAALNHNQTLMMVPTEVLAEQHARTLTRLFDGLPVRMALLTGSTKHKQRIKQEIAEGKYELVVGTHALIEEDLSVPGLGLVIVDEQHRFGVRQRQALLDRGSRTGSAHFLSLTATPIPRTYALMLYGDLDISTMHSKPAGRKPIKTHVVADSATRQKMYAFLRREIAAGRQVFVLCPAIDAADTSGMKSVTQEWERLRAEVFTDIPMGLLHGKLKAKEKQEVMRAFAARETMLLVTTTVIEVGVDIPNASCMVIEEAHRFGLAQLHQLRGRVGRGEAQSYCFVSSENASQAARARLDFFAGCTDGFVLAQYDLDTRGPGDLFGDMQSGDSAFTVASVADTPLLERGSVIAQALVGESGEVTKVLDTLWYGRTRNVHAAHLE